MFGDILVTETDITGVKMFTLRTASDGCLISDVVAGDVALLLVGADDDAAAARTDDDDSEGGGNECEVIDAFLLFPRFIAKKLFSVAIDFACGNDDVDDGEACARFEVLMFF